MKKILSTTLFLIVFTNMGFGQNLTQTVRGAVIDSDSRLPMIGAKIILVDSFPIRGTSSDVNGRFRLENIPIGRISLRISYSGYETIIIPNLSVNSGKEMVLNLEMTESAISMDELVVTANMQKAEVLNDLALVSSRSVSAEETSRFAGGFNDPSRILSSTSGIFKNSSGCSPVLY